MPKLSGAGDRGKLLNVGEDQDGTIAIPRSERGPTHKLCVTLSTPVVPWSLADWTHLSACPTFAPPPSIGGVERVFPGRVSSGRNLQTDPLLKNYAESASEAGRVNKKVEPWLSSLSARIVPS